MNVQTFDFKGAGIRTVEIDGEIHFVAKDVCDALGYFEVQSTIDKLDEDEHLISKITSSGQARDMKLVTESGLYTLIIRSNKEEAKEFRRWVTHEVLPAIRKQGFYAMGTEQGEFGFGRQIRIPRELTAGFIHEIVALYGRQVAQKLFAPYLGIKLEEAVA